MSERELIVRLAEVKREIAALEKEKEGIERQLKPIAIAAFQNQPRGVKEAERDGIKVQRKWLRTDIKSTDPQATARALIELDENVFSSTLVKKSLLDDIGAKYSDSAVIIAGERVPGLVATPLYGYSYEPTTISDAERMLFEEG